MSERPDFWSSRRAKVQAEEAAQAADDAALASQAQTDARESDAAEKTDEDLLAELDLPDPDSLVMGDDLTAFMRKEVPERLRRRALRRFWRTNPVLACLDGLNDYDGDFTNAATDAPGVATAYRVGKGMLHHIETLAREAEQAKTVADVEAEADTSDKSDHKDTVRTADIPPPDVVFGKNAPIGGEARALGDAALASTTKVAMSEPPIGEKSEPEQDFAAQPRRMRFRFGTETG